MVGGPGIYCVKFYRSMHIYNLFPGVSTASQRGLTWYHANQAGLTQKDVYSQQIGFPSLKALHIHPEEVLHFETLTLNLLMEV